MAWMLLEELLKAGSIYLASYFLKGMWRVTMKEKCMISCCARPKSKRGLCLVCFNRAKQKVENGETTWERLEIMGLCEGEYDPFIDAYNKAMKDN